MDFVGYAERSADLVNASVEDGAALVRLLADRAWLQPKVTDRDAAAVRRFQQELRAVFEASDAGEEEQVVDQLNHLLSRHPVTPHIAGRQTRQWHLHVADQSSSVAELLVAECLMGLATLVCDLGPLRLGVCRADRCARVFVDISPNQSRRYCCERCASRANVAAYRARQRSGDQHSPSQQAAGSSRQTPQEASA